MAKNKVTVEETKKLIVSLLEAPTITKKMIAVKARVSPRTVGRWEDGESVPTEEQYMELLDFYYCNSHGCGLSAPPMLVLKQVNEPVTEERKNRVSGVDEEAYQLINEVAFRSNTSQRETASMLIKWACEHIKWDCAREEE